jgi:hypothetical protein
LSHFLKGNLLWLFGESRIRLGFAPARTKTSDSEVARRASLTEDDFPKNES